MYSTHNRSGRDGRDAGHEEQEFEGTVESLDVLLADDAYEVKDLSTPNVDTGEITATVTHQGLQIHDKTMALFVYYENLFSTMSD